MSFQRMPAALSPRARAPGPRRYSPREGLDERTLLHQFRTGERHTARCEGGVEMKTDEGTPAISEQSADETGAP